MVWVRSKRDRIRIDPEPQQLLEVCAPLREQVGFSGFGHDYYVLTCDAATCDVLTCDVLTCHVLRARTCDCPTHDSAPCARRPARR